MKSQLLATFTTKDNLDETIEKIVDAYTIIFNKVYVLQNENNVNELKHNIPIQKKQIEKPRIDDRDIVLNDKIISDTSSESGSELDFDLNDFEESL